MNPLIKYLGTIIVVVVILALPVMLLWNAVVPNIFGMPDISFWQALGLSLLSHCLFGRVNINNRV